MGGQGATCAQGVQQAGRVLRIGPGRQLDYHGTRGAVGVDELAVDAEADQHGAAVSRNDPELIAVPAARQDELVVGDREGLADAGLRGAGIEQTAVGQRPRDAADDRFRHRHEQVHSGGRHARVVLLSHQLPVVQHDQRVCVRSGEHLRRRRRAAVEPPDQRVGQRPGGGGQRRRAAGARRDQLAGNELAHVPECPPVERGILPVGQGDLRFRSRREASHEPVVSHDAHPNAAPALEAVI